MYTVGGCGSVFAVYVRMSVYVCVCMCVCVCVCEGLAGAVGAKVAILRGNEVSVLA